MRRTRKHKKTGLSVGPRLNWKNNRREGAATTIFPHDKGKAREFKSCSHKEQHSQQRKNRRKTKKNYMYIPVTTKKKQKKNKKELYIYTRNPLARRFERRKARNHAAFGDASNGARGDTVGICWVFVGVWSGISLLKQSIRVEFRGCPGLLDEIFKNGQIWEKWVLGRL